MSTFLWVWIAIGIIAFVALAAAGAGGWLLYKDFTGQLGVKADALEQQIQDTISNHKDLQDLINMHSQISELTNTIKSAYIDPETGGPVGAIQECINAVKS